MNQLVLGNVFLKQHGQYKDSTDTGSVAGSSIAFKQSFGDASLQAQ